MNTNAHTHEWHAEGHKYKCSCGAQMLKFDKDDKGVLRSTRSDGKVYTKKANKDRFFFPKEWQKFEDQLKGKQKFSCKCLLHTGARWKEIASVQVRDFVYIPKGRSMIILRHTKTKARKGELKEKGGKVRNIPVSKQFATYLSNHIKAKGLKEDDTLGILSDNALITAMKKAAKKARLSHPEDFSPHNLRKTLEVWLMALGVDSMKLLAHFGHNISTAAMHYVSPDIFGWQDKTLMRRILGDLYEEKRR